MYQNILIESLDSFAQGIAHINNKVVFIKNALPTEIVDIKIIKEYKNYDLAIVIKYHKLSPLRKESICPHFSKCGGCNLLFYNYEDTLKYKKESILKLWKQNQINLPNLEIISSSQDYNYRHKLSVKIVNGKLGFYEEKTHELVPIKKCFIASCAINEVIKNYNLLNLKNANLTIRTNTNNEILLIISSKEKANIDLETLKAKIKLIGLVYNEKTLYGNNFYYERLNNFLFKVSYDSFFQVNPYITKELFKLVNEYITPKSQVLDLYSGVGTLSLVASLKAQMVYSVEIIPNAVLNGIFNAKINKRNNIKFFLGDTSKIVNKLNINFDTLILDPPRKGLDKNTIKFIKANLPKKVIYISCDVHTLIRDYKLLQDNYDIIKYQLLDMFSYTYHVESFCVLNLK